MKGKRGVLVFLCVCAALVPLFSIDDVEDELKVSSEVKSQDKARTELKHEVKIGGGVKTGILVKNLDYGGKLGNIALGPDNKYPMTLYFASYENNALNGEGWLNASYSLNADRIGKFGLALGLWAHGDIKEFKDVVHLGDHYVWANFFDDRLRFIGGQGGGAPISSGGWINADWLSYTGFRFFWVDPIGLSVGINFPDPGWEGIKPANYFSLLGAGVAYKNDRWSISVQFDNSPIYDDSESNYYGGLHRPDDQEPIGQKGNIAVGVGVEKLYGGKGFLVIDSLFTNLGADEEQGRGDYTISPIQMAFALKTGWPITDRIYAEIKAKYTISKGDADDYMSAEAPAIWGKLETEPYFSFQAFPNIGFNLSVYTALYINSYYLALPVQGFDVGQVPGYGPLLDYLSAYYVTIKTGVTFKVGGAEVVAGYAGSFSRDHTENNIYLDCKWSF